MEFEVGLELRVGRNKGGTVETILPQVDSESPVAYPGDELPDEAAFRAGNRKGFNRFGALVRSQWHDPVADLWLQPSVELSEFLKCWLQAGGLTPDRHSVEWQPIKAIYT